MNDLVSIITPSFNSEKYISETIQSVINQTYKNWELLIVDDCSFDSTSTIVQHFQSTDARIQFVTLDKNSGAGVARDTALQLAKGRYIAFLDSDDVWKPEKLEKQLAFMKQENQPFAFSFYDCIDEDSKPLNKRVEAPNPLTYKQYFFCNYVGNLTGIYDVDYFGKIAISSIRKRQDWMVWLTIIKKLQSAKPVPESLAFYRIRKDSLSTSKVKLLKHNYTVYRKFHKLNIFISLICMIGFLFTQLIIKPRYIKKLT
ncbi:MAG: glycosyltransferase family 2 protein [Limnohabitans sp.]|nr:glycosyltransferase family 2 protein [Limnohabitans sp.]